MSRWASIWSAGLLVTACVLEPAAAQHRVTVRAINSVPQGNIAKLANGRSALTEQDIRDLISSPLEGDTVAVKVVVLSNPRNSGVAEVVHGQVPRVLFFVRDVAADSLGMDGMGIQVIDDRWEEHGLLDLKVGDVVEMTAVVSEMQNVITLNPLAIVEMGSYASHGLPDEILAADHSFEVEELNLRLQNGGLQANWLVLRRIHGSPICLDQATVARRIVPDPPDRVDWALTSRGESRLYAFDASHRFRNDTRSTYPPTFNLREDDFQPPPVEAVVNVCGFLVLQPFNDPDGAGVPLASSIGTMFSLIPFEDSDLQVIEVPPVVERVSRPSAVLTSADHYRVSAYVEPDPVRSITSAVLTYTVDDRTIEKPMGAVSNNRWIATIPATGRDGAFVRYHVRALDSAGSEVTSVEYQYRTLDAGIDSITDIQSTYDEGPGASPFAGLEVPVDIWGVVQSHPEASGLVTIQDDATLSPWSGVFVDRSWVAPLLLHAGDRLHVTRALVDEVDGVTQLDRLTVDEVVRGDSTLGYASLMTTDLRKASIAESYEGMLVQVSSALTTAALSDGLWTITNGHYFDSIPVTSRLSQLPDTVLAGWGLRPYVRGVWTESGSEWLLALESLSDIGDVVNVAVEEAEVTPTPSTRLGPNYPNPFKQSTTIPFSLSDAGPVRIEIFDIAGRRVRLLDDADRPSGRAEIAFDASDLAVGPYVVRLTADSGSDSMIVLRMD